MARQNEPLISLRDRLRKQISRLIFKNQRLTGKISRLIFKNRRMAEQNERLICSAVDCAARLVYCANKLVGWAAKTGVRAEKTVLRPCFSMFSSPRSVSDRGTQDSESGQILVAYSLCLL